MHEYDDSFETDSTPSDEENKATPVHTSAASSSSSSSVESKAKSSTNADAHDVTSGSTRDEEAPPAAATRARRVATASPPPIAPVPLPAASPITIAPGVGPVPLPVPVPISSAAARNSPDHAPSASRAAAASEHSERVSGGSSASASPPLPMPRGRAGALNSPLDDVPFASGSGQSDGTAMAEWRRATGQSSSKLSNSDSAGLPREIAEKAARAGEGAEFQALSNFVAFGSGRASTATAATNYTNQTSQRTSEVHVAPTPQSVQRQFVAFPASEEEEEDEEGRERASSAAHATREDSATKATAQPSPAPEPSTATPAATPAAAGAEAAESPQKTPSDTKSASVAPSSVFSTLSQHLQTAAPQPQPLHPSSSSGAARLPSLPLPLAPPSLAAPSAAAAGLAANTTPAAPPPPLTAASSPLALSEPQTAASPSKASATVVGIGSATAAAPIALTLPSLPPPSWATTNTTTNTNTTAAAATALHSGSVLSGPPSSTPGGMMGPSSAAVPSTASYPTETVPASRWMPGSGSGVPRDTTTSFVDQTLQRVAPLPPPPEPRRLTAEEARVSELREASEAVERLVKAFATLKGYGALEKSELASATAAAKASVSAATSTAHRPGAAPTVQVRVTKPVRGPRVPSAVYDTNTSTSRSATAPARTGGATSSPFRGSSGEGEQLAEGLVLDCVLGMLQEHAKQKRQAALESGEVSAKDNDESSEVGALWKAARPHYEVISADNFSTAGVGRTRGGGRSGRGAAAGAASSSARVYANPPAMLDGVPGIDVPLFDPRDRQSATDLYNVAREALAKYVLRRVRTSEDGPLPAEPMPVSHITAAFAWALLLDVAAVCQEIARCAFDAAAASPSSVYPVLVQFRGDAACTEVARAAMHCLPFEALHPADNINSSSGSTSERASATEVRGCLFRMACWVTQEQLWTVSDALMDTVRDDVAKRAKAAQYAAFSTAAPTEVDPRLLVPPQLPMFTLRPLPNKRGAPAVTPTAADNTTVYKRTHRDSAGEGSALTRDLFDVPMAALQKAAYSVSVLSTNILSSSGPDSILASVRAEDYAEVALAVSETISELLQDESIKAAVQRRAAEKVQKAQMTRTNYVSATRQRKEQAIISKAEREAEEMVQHILQEMRAQGVSQST